MLLEVLLIGTHGFCQFGYGVVAAEVFFDHLFRQLNFIVVVFVDQDLLVFIFHIEGFHLVDDNVQHEGLNLQLIEVGIGEVQVKYLLQGQCNPFIRLGEHPVAESLLICLVLLVIRREFIARNKHQ